MLSNFPQNIDIHQILFSNWLAVYYSKTSNFTNQPASDLFTKKISAWRETNTKIKQRVLGQFVVLCSLAQKCKMKTPKRLR